MKILNLRIVFFRIKKHQLCLICLITLTTGVFAQTKVGETCETKLKNTQLQLRKTTTKLQDTIQALRETENLLQETIEILNDTEVRLSNTEDEFSKYKINSSELLQMEKSAKQKVENELQTTKQELRNVETKNDELKGILSKIQNAYPIIITKIELGNIDNNNNIINDYGSTLYSSSMRYLKPKFYYTSLLEQSKTLKLYMKIYKPNGALFYNSAISTTYTSDTDASIYIGNNLAYLSSWGNSEQSAYPVGTYRIEIWYNNVCLGQKSFYIN